MSFGDLSVKVLHGLGDQLTRKCFDDFVEPGILRIKEQNPHPKARFER
jgi:hypothetical protein